MTKEIFEFLVGLFRRFQQFFSGTFSIFLVVPLGQSFFEEEILCFGKNCH